MTFTIQPTIQLLQPKLLVGMRMEMSLANNQTFRLWQTFMPRRREILNASSSNLFSLQLYAEPLRLGDLHQSFSKWAAIEVSHADSIPEGMDMLHLPSGLYAVFTYKGLSTDSGIFIYIFSEWLPQSEFVLDHRPHFEILGEKYKNGDPNSEEEIWIPVKSKH